MNQLLRHLCPPNFFIHSCGYICLPMGLLFFLVVALRSRGIFVSRIICGIWDFLLIPICFCVFPFLVVMFQILTVLFFFFLVTAAHVLFSGMFLLLVCLKAFRNCFMLVIRGSIFSSLNFSWLSGNHTIADFFLCRARCISCSSP